MPHNDARKRTLAKLVKELGSDLRNANSATNALLAMLAQSILDYRETTEQIAREGRTIEAGTGSLKLHPAVAYQKQSADLITRLAAELLLTPKARRLIENELPSELDNYGDDGA